MPKIRKARNASAKTQLVEPSETQGEPSGLQQTPPPVGICAARKAKLGEEFLDSHVATLTHRDCHFEAALPMKIVSLDSLHPRPEWSALDSGASVMGSLIALNAHLMFYERLRRAS